MRSVAPLSKTIDWFIHSLRLLWQGTWWQRLLLVSLAVFSFSLLGMYGVARWYVASTNDRPLELGVSFVPDYARSLGLDGVETMDALIQDAGVDRFRLVSYWNKHEITPEHYDFTDLDWQFRKAEAAGAKVTLAMGLRQPRWPECHMPDWAQSMPAHEWQARLNLYMKVVAERYKTSPSLESYQLENEYFNDFGICPDTDRQRLAAEYTTLKQADPAHPIIISRSNNFPNLILGEPQPDITGMSVYRRVWDAKWTKAYFDYPLPSWYYAFLAGSQKLAKGQESVLHELQMEPWPPNGKFIADIRIEEQDKSMRAEMFDDRIEFAKNTGMRKVDLWGAEWWYWRKEKMNDPAVWNEAKEVFHGTSR